MKKRKNRKRKNKKSPQLIHGMKIQTALRYIKARESIEDRADRIHAIGDLMSQLKHADGAYINHLTASWIGDTITKDVIMILNHLDNDFIFMSPSDLKKV